MNHIRERRPIHLQTSAGKPSGCVLSDGVLTRYALGSKHLLRRPPAWAFETQILETAKGHGAELVRVIDKETGITYTAPLDAFDRYGITIQRGYGEQVALPLNRWRQQRAQQLALF